MITAAELFHWARGNNFDSESSGRSALARAVAESERRGSGLLQGVVEQINFEQKDFANDLRAFFRLQSRQPSSFSNRAVRRQLRTSRTTTVDRAATLLEPAAALWLAATEAPAAA